MCENEKIKHKYNRLTNSRSTRHYNNKVITSQKKIQIYLKDHRQSTVNILCCKTMKIIMLNYIKYD